MLDILQIPYKTDCHQNKMLYNLHVTTVCRNGRLPSWPVVLAFRSLRRFGEMSGEELVMRVLGTLGSGLGVFCAQHGVYSVVAFVAVGPRLSEPSYRRPLYRSISRANTICRFWRYALYLRPRSCRPTGILPLSRVWHQEDDGARPGLCARNTEAAQRVLHSSPDRPDFLISELLHATINFFVGL